MNSTEFNKIIHFKGYGINGKNMHQDLVVQVIKVSFKKLLHENLILAFSFLFYILCTFLI